MQGHPVDDRQHAALLDTVAEHLTRTLQQRARGNGAPRAMARRHSNGAHVSSAGSHRRPKQHADSMQVSVDCAGRFVHVGTQPVNASQPADSETHPALTDAGRRSGYEAARMSLRPTFLVDTEAGTMASSTHLASMASDAQATTLLGWQACRTDAERFTTSAPLLSASSNLYSMWVQSCAKLYAWQREAPVPISSPPCYFIGAAGAVDGRATNGESAAAVSSGDLEVPFWLPHFMEIHMAAYENPDAGTSIDTDVDAASMDSFDAGTFDSIDGLDSFDDWTSEAATASGPDDWLLETDPDLVAMRLFQEYGPQEVTDSDDHLGAAAAAAGAAPADAAAQPAPAGSNALQELSERMREIDRSTSEHAARRLPAPARRKRWRSMADADAASTASPAAADAAAIGAVPPQRRGGHPHVDAPDAASVFQGMTADAAAAEASVLSQVPHLAHDRSVVHSPGGDAAAKAMRAWAAGGADNAAASGFSAADAQQHAPQNGGEQGGEGPAAQDSESEDESSDSVEAWPEDIFRAQRRASDMTRTDAPDDWQYIVDPELALPIVLQPGGLPELDAEVEQHVQQQWRSIAGGPDLGQLLLSTLQVPRLAPAASPAPVPACCTQVLWLLHEQHVCISSRMLIVDTMMALRWYCMSDCTSCALGCPVLHVTDAVCAGAERRLKRLCLDR